MDATTADVLGHTIVSATLAECAAWRLAHALGGVFEEIVVPQVMRQLDEVDSLAPGALCRRREGKPQSDDPFTKVREQCLAAAFFDSLIGQQDRNKNNWLWHAGNGEFCLIDHGFAFARPGDTFVNLRFTRWRWAKKEQQLVDNEVEALKALLSSEDLLGLRRFLDEDRCDALHARAAEMWRTSVLMPAGEY